MSRALGVSLCARSQYVAADRAYVVTLDGSFLYIILAIKNMEVTKWHDCGKPHLLGYIFEEFVY